MENLLTKRTNGILYDFIFITFTVRYGRLRCFYCLSKNNGLARLKYVNIFIYYMRPYTFLIFRKINKNRLRPERSRAQFKRRYRTLERTINKRRNILICIHMTCIQRWYIFNTTIYISRMPKCEYSCFSPVHA